MNRSRPACPSVSGDNVQDIPATPALDHLQARGARAVKRPVQDDVDDGIPSVDGELFRGADEIPGGVVHKDVERAKAAKGFLAEAVHLRGLAHIGRYGEHIGALGAELFGRGLQMLRAAAREHELCAQACKFCGDGEPNARPPSSDDGDAVFERTFGKHWQHPLCARLQPILGRSPSAK